MSLRRIASAALAVAALATIAAPAVNAATATKKSAATTTTKKSPATAGPAAAGKKVFEAQCAVCHSISPGDGGMVGPSLKGVVGRKAATVPGFAYSKPMKAKSNLWTAGNLEIYLADPQKFAPGSGMPVNVPSAADRTAVIAYLSTVK